LMTFIPKEPYVGMLSIPRDLWVVIPEYGANRINTAHFFAEADQPGSGPAAAMETVRTNFGVDVHYYLRLHHIAFLELVDGLGGIDVVFSEARSGYPAGTHHLNGGGAERAAGALGVVKDPGFLADGQPIPGYGYPTVEAAPVRICGATGGTRRDRLPDYQPGYGGALHFERWCRGACAELGSH